MTTDGLENRKKIRQDFYKNFLKSFDAGAWITGIPRYMFTAPILLFSAGMAMALAVGSALPKLPSGLPDLIQFKLDKYDLADAYQKSGHGRFKIVEHFVNCNYPESARRMYNYLMIYGLLRTGTFILLISFWLEANQILIEKYKFVLINLPSYAHIRDRPGSYGMILTLTALLSTAYFCYIKFNRRYFEEAMLAFALRKE